MKLNKILTILTLIITAFGLGACGRQSERVSIDDQTSKQTAKTGSHDDHANQTASRTPKPQKPVPAFQSAESAKNLKPTLPPEMFNGTVRAAYAAVREIPETIAQLPCFCRCDRSAGHKSLHSCFEDDHGANCGICMNSALKAYKLQKEQKLTPAQIREQIVAEYAGY